ncbi:RecF/RecN/SMC N terminal domain [Popillia japonica]|uniref:RecF/RecN/SMC N terminal domain n=1 Tax=Popillia japonica TaxID=7064 RepID=A0AAW1MDU4_POPJA
MPRTRKRALTPSPSENPAIKEKRSKNNRESTSDTPRQKRVKSRAGTISRITLKNFMCHSHLEVNLQNNINYITGRNGSGKSAILVALAVGLAGKASITNRGTSVKCFVKAGQTSATVEIVLRNSGSSAYKSGVYGNEIIIQRTFNVNGSSTYRIKSATGEIISKSSKEIHQIRSNLNIQIDNPTLDEQYKITLNNSKEIDRTIEEKTKVYEELKSLLKKLEKQIERIRKIGELKNKETLLNTELWWAKVRDIEDEYNDRVKIAENLEIKCKKYEDNSKNKNQRLEEIKQKASDLQQQIMELKEAAEIQNRPQLDVQNEIDGLRQSYSEKRRLKQRLMKDIQDKNKNIATLTGEIENFTANLNKIEQEKLAKRKEMSDLEAQISHVETKIESTENEVFQMKSSISRQEEQENHLQKELKQIETSCAQITDRINTLKNESNALVLYGKDMPAIVNAIHTNKKRFTDLPRGPLGAYINVRDKKWDVAIEGYIGTSLLRSFTVDNKKDNAVLMEILNKHCRSGQKPMIITSKFYNRVHDIASNLIRADPDCISLYDAIDIKDPVVANCLIDQTSIESILLIPSTERAIELLSDQNRVPRNCSQGVTIKGDKYYPDPNYKTYASRYHKARYLQVDTGDLVRGCEETLAELTSNMKNIKTEINAIVMDKTKQKRELAGLTKKVEKLRQTNVVTKRKLEELRTMDDSESVNVQSLESETAELNRTVQRLTAQHEEIDQQMESIKETIKGREERLVELAQVMKGFEDKIAPLEQQIREQTNEKQELDVSKTFEKKRLQEAKNKLALAQSEVLKKKEELTKLTDEAISIGERVERLRQVPEIVEEISNIKNSISKAESSLGNATEIGNKYETTKQKHDHVTKVLEHLNNSIHELGKAITNRKRYYQHVEDYYVNHINHSFKRVLDFRQFKGQMDINIIEKKLELVVIPQQGSQGLTVTSNLSGGERSFSTVAFLYSLWQCTNFPFYFLDEFDVYMDKINRSRVMDILIHHAKERSDLQFVFLTPQDVSCIRDKDVSIHRLEDPDRRTVPDISSTSESTSVAMFNGQAVIMTGLTQASRITLCCEPEHTSGSDSDEHPERRTNIDRDTPANLSVRILLV